MRIRHAAPAFLAMLLLGGATAWSQEASGSAPDQSPLTAVGGDTCVSCHDTLGDAFTRSVHGQLADFERHGQTSQCEACHGLGSRHAESGDPADIRVFRDADVAESSRACLNCHRQDAAMEWASSAHAGSEVACTSCHTIHQSRRVISDQLQGVEGFQRTHATAPAPRGSLAKPETEICLDCHPEQRAKLAMSSRHPIQEGAMSCSSCHDPHGGQPGQAMLKTTERVNDLCYTCHQSKQGPFVFEHAPVEESCLTCHDPHGSVANNLLKQGEPFLCLQCHEMHFHSARVVPATSFPMPSGATINNWSITSFQEGYNTRCSACHSRIHGSDLPSQGVSGRGKALTR